MATITHSRATEADLLAVPKDGNKYELVDGEILVSPTGMRHEIVGGALFSSLQAHAGPRHLGFVLGSSMGYRLAGGNVRSPDVSFVASSRMPAPADRDGYMDGAPDLAVEIISPGERVRRVHDRVGEYLEAGVRLVWVIDPKRRTAFVYRGTEGVHTVGADGEMDGGDVMPGFHFRLADVLE